MFPQLHFSKKVRGRLEAGTKVFEGDSLDAMEKYVPKDLTRRMIFSKNGAIFDMYGKFAPITSGLKVIEACRFNQCFWDKKSA